MRCRFTVRETRGGIHQRAAEMAQLVFIDIEHHEQAVALLHGNTHAVFETPVIFLRNDQFIDQQLDTVVFVAVEFHAGENFPDFSIDPHRKVSFATQLFEKFLVMAFAVSYQRSKNIGLAPQILLADKL